MNANDIEVLNAFWVLKVNFVSIGSDINLLSETDAQ